jgi:hypothetical protein
MSQPLTEKFGEILESSKYAGLTMNEKVSMALLLENTEKEYERLLAEGSSTSDIAQFTPILMPLVRRVYPGLIANELLGVQAMTMPTGFMYSLTNRYTGTGEAGNGTSGESGLNGSGVILKLAVGAGTDTIVQTGVGKTITGATSGATGTILYTEVQGKAGATYVMALVKQTSAAAFGVETITVTGSDDVVTCSATFTNEASFRVIFKNYTGPVTTAVGEVLGKDMKEIGFTIAKKSIEAKTRKLKGQYTLEMYQDLKAQHGLMADEEIMSLIGAEMQNEIDREVVSFVNSNATQCANAFAFTASSTDGSGRWEIEKYRTQAIKIATEARQIGLDIKRGQGNTLVVSPKVATMLEQIGSFTVAPMASGVNVPLSGGVAGTFDGKYKVVVDQYAVSDYATVLYKGTDRRDGMGVFAPYVPLSFQKVNHTDSGQPAIIASTRYALETNPIDSALYARSFGIDFANTALRNY